MAIWAQVNCEIGIVASYRRLLEVHPGMAGVVSQDLLAWQCWDLRKLLTECAPDVESGSARVDFPEAVLV